MKKSFAKTLFILLIFAVLATSAPATATAAEPIGVADYKAVLENCNAYGDMLSRLNSEMDAAKVDLGRQLMAETNPVRRRQLTLQFEDNYAKRRSELVRPLFEKVKTTVVQVAKEYGLSRVEDSASGVRGVDITKAVIAALNSSTPAPQPRQYAQQPAQQTEQYTHTQPAQPSAQYTQAQPFEQDPFAAEDPALSKKAKKAKKAQAKAEKAARRAEKLAERAKAAQQKAQQLAQVSPEMPEAAAQQQQYAQPAQPQQAAVQTQAKPADKADALIAELNTPKRQQPRGVLFTPQPAAQQVSAVRSSVRPTTRRYVAPAVEIPSLETTITEEVEIEEEAAPAAPKKTARKTASKQYDSEVVRAVRPRRTLQAADVPAKSEPNSVSEASARQKKAAAGTRNSARSSRSRVEVQFGADYDKADIARMVNLAQKNGIQGAYLLETVSPKTGKLFCRARVPASSRAEAQEITRRLKAIGLHSYVTEGK